MDKTRALVIVSFIISGTAALIYEIVWLRPIQFILGSTTYTISIVIGGFLIGLSIGGYLGAKKLKKHNPLFLYGFIEAGIAFYGLFFLFVVLLLPDIYRAIFSLKENFHVFLFAEFFVAFMLVLIPTILMGATYPVAARIYARKKAKDTGELYSANNLGAITGSLLAGFLLLSLLGIKGSLLAAASLNFAVSSIMLLSYNRHIAKKALPVMVAAFIAISWSADYNVLAMFTSGIGRAHIDKSYLEQARILYNEEGTEATVTVIEEPNKGISFLINGKGAGSNDITDVRVNTLIAYLPLLLHPDPKKSFVIGLGTGTTSGILSRHTKTTTAEIEAKVVKASEYFSFMNQDPLNNPNHTLVISDARNVLFTSKEKYDIISTNPLEPWQSFSSVLFSKEFFEIAKTKLEENGIFVQWVPLYTLSPEEFKIFYKTFNSVFPHVLVFANLRETENFPVKLNTTELVFLGSEKEIEFDLEKLKERFFNLPYEDKSFLSVARLESPEKIQALYLFNEKDLEGYAGDASVVTDDYPVLEFTTLKTTLSRASLETLPDILMFVKGGKNE